MGLLETLRQAWADEDIRARLLFILGMFAIYAIGVHIPVPIRGIDPTQIASLLENNQFFALLNTIGGGAFKRISILALGLTPYITASIVMQILTQTTPSWKQEMQEGGEYARRKQNQRIRAFTLALCLFQGWGLLTGIATVVPTIQLGPVEKLGIVACWTAGSMLMLWMGEQISERGIGNGISIMIFAGIAISFPTIIGSIRDAIQNGALSYVALFVVTALFVLTTWVIVYFTVAQRRIPIQHMRRNYGTKSMGGQTSYLPISVNMANVMPILFAMSLLYLPAQIASMTPPNTPFHDALNEVARFLRPDFADWRGWVGALFYTLLIFGFTYLWTAIMFNVEDIANNLKRGGSYIPGVRPGKQTMEFLNGVISRVTFVGAVFLAAVALSQYLTPLIAPGAAQALGFIGGTSLLILVSVALETMRQIEANLLVKQYNG
jgi:preprotein translocase subunit SecY